MSQILFALILALCIGFSFRAYRRIWLTISLGKDDDQTRSKSLAWKRVALVAFGQKKMFKKWLPASLHFFIYSAFLLTQLELVEIITDGLTGSHRLFGSALGPVYPLIINLIEILSFLALLATVVFLLRRTLFSLSRFQKPEMKGWPSLDGKLILIGELVLIFAIFTMNGADYLLQDLNPDYPKLGGFLLSSAIVSPLLDGLSVTQLVLTERLAWWAHIIAVFGFISYLPFSKHLHIAFAFPTVYYSSQSSSGQIENIPVITREIKSMMGLAEESDSGDEVPQFGAKDIFDLKKQTLLSAYSCTECGRCTEACPANITEKKLSPRKIMMDIRDRCEEVSAEISKGQLVDPYDDGKSLWDRISEEEIFACTSCQACVEVCPIMINPLEPIIEMRRYQILNEGAGPTDWIPMFTSIENSGSAWQVQSTRTAWTDA